MTVTKVDIRNRLDCCGSRLRAAKVFVGDKEFGQLPDGNLANGEWFTVEGEPTKGGKVRVVLTKRDYLHMAAVHVHGY